MRHYMRSQTVEGVTDTRAIDEVGLSVARSKKCIAISPLPTMKIVLLSRPAIGKWRAMPSQNATAAVSATFGDGCHGSDSKFNLFNSSRIDAINITEVRDKAEGE